MKRWWVANGGPLALMIAGLALTGWTTQYGWILVAVGAVWWVGESLYSRSPWTVELRRKRAAAPEAAPRAPASPADRLPAQAATVPTQRDRRRERAERLLKESEPLEERLWRERRTGSRVGIPLISTDLRKKISAWNAEVLQLADECLSVRDAGAVRVVNETFGFTLNAETLGEIIEDNRSVLRRIARQ